MPNTLKSFDRSVSYYDETRGFPAGVESQAAALICKAANLNQRSAIFEIGIGTGRIAVPLLPFVNRICGLDVSRGMMDVLRNKPRGREIHLTQGLGTALPFENGVFDGCIAAHIFHLIDDPQMALNEVARVLKSGAPLISCMSKNGDEKMNFAREAYNAAASNEPAPKKRGSQCAAEIIEAYGWRAIGAEQILSYKTHTVPRVFIEQHQRRIYSSQWGHDDAAHARGMHAMQEAIAQKYADIDQVVVSESGFAVQLYLPPK
jgi:ubiquinone/menaquinone biosynthesis C-methylase UbiE